MEARGSDAHVGKQESALLQERLSRFEVSSDVKDLGHTVYFVLHPDRERKDSLEQRRKVFKDLCKERRSRCVEVRGVRNALCQSRYVFHSGASVANHVEGCCPTLIFVQLSIVASNSQA